MTERQEFTNFQEIPYSEQLIAQIGLNLPFEELRVALAPVALLGAAQRLWIAFRPTEELSLELANKLEHEEGENLTRVRVASLNIRDITSNYVETRPLTSPRAIDIGIGGVSDSVITVYTPDTEALDPILEFEITPHDEPFRLTIDQKEASSMELLSFRNLDRYVHFEELFQATYHEGNPQTLRVSRKVALADAPIIESKRIWNRVERLKEMLATGAPSQLIEIERRMLIDPIQKLLMLLGSNLSEAETIEFAQRFISEPTEEIIKGVFNVAGENISPLVLQFFRAGLTTANVSPPTEWSVSASFRIEDQDDEGRQLLVEEVEGITSPSLSQWEKAVEKFSQEEGRLLLNELEIMKETMKIDYDNFAAILTSPEMSL